MSLEVPGRRYKRKEAYYVTLIGTRIDQKVGPRFVPGVIVSDEVFHDVATFPSRATGQLVSRPVTKVKVITLRGTNPDNGPVTQYHVLTTEDTGFQFPRSEPVVGLDYDRNGDRLSINDLIELTKADMLANDERRRAAMTELEIAL